MVKLNDLPPQALSAALRTGTSEWGRRGSAWDHALYIQELPKRLKGWRLCRCGCRKRASHAVMANGIALASGCEMKARRSLREMSRGRSQRPIPPSTEREEP